MGSRPLTLPPLGSGGYDQPLKSAKSQQFPRGLPFFGKLSGYHPPLQTLVCTHLRCSLMKPTIFLLRTLWLTIAVLITSLAQHVTAQSTANTQENFPVAASKKGLQVELIDDAIALKVQHATFNINLCSLVSTSNDPSDYVWNSQGQEYRFKRKAVDHMDQNVRRLTEAGALVYAILLTYQSGNPAIDKLMIHPNCIDPAPNRLGAFNSATDEGRRALSATIEFLSERWSRADKSCGRVVGYIVGNEVNSHWWWSNMGRVSMSDFADQYVQVVRIIHAAVRKHSSVARVYVSLEHHWTIRYPPGSELQSFPARDFLLYFASRMKELGDLDWHIAFHPYPERLTEPRFWNDKSATHDQETKRITFKNVEQLIIFLQRPEMRFGEQTRRVIFSEQGFHTPKGDNGQTIQAAAFCLAYKKIEALDGVDAFILHRHVDNDHEGGLMLGLRSNKPIGDDRHPAKKIYECFRDADTPKWEETFRFALPIVGLNEWSKQ